jgi:spore germination protein YaaH
LAGFHRVNKTREKNITEKQNKKFPGEKESKRMTLAHYYSNGRCPFSAFHVMWQLAGKDLILDLGKLFFNQLARCCK